MQMRRCHTLTRAAIAAAMLVLHSSGTTPAPASPADEQQDLLAGRPLLRVPTFGEAPELNGALDDPAWSAAEPATPFWHFQTGARSAHDTWARMGIDDRFVYVGFHCEEAEMGRLEPQALPPDSLAVYANDHVELFLMPDALGGPFYHFSVDIAGNRHDEIGGDASWGCDWQAATRLGGDAWEVELRIPREAVGLSDPRMSLANFCRTRRLTPGETSAWSKTFGIFHNPARFGRIVYGPDATVAITAAALAQPRIGENRVGLSISSAGEPTDVLVEGYAGEGDGMSRFGARQVHLGQGATSEVSLELHAERDARARLLIVVEGEGHVLTFCDASEMALTGAKAAPIRQVLGPEAAPFMRWIDRERLRGISYGFAFTGKIPDTGLVRADAPDSNAPAEAIRLRGESYFRVLLEEGEPLRFDLGATEGDAPFTSSIYAAFDPEGRMVGKGIVEAGRTAQVTIPATTPGHYTLLVNSGPASWNPFSITVHHLCWALDARGKSTYVHTPISLHSLRDCSLAGMNVALMAAWQWGIPFGDDEGLARWSDTLERLCQAARDADIRLIPYVGWGCARTECEAAGDYTRALTRLSVRGPHPCPISREYWDRSFLRRALAVARLSTKYPAVIGVGLDPESYYFGGWYSEHLDSAQEKQRAGAIYQPYGSSPEKCACNNCFYGFLKSRDLPAPDLPEDGNARFDWIAERGLLDDYCAYQQAELEEIMQDVRQRVHAVNPDLCFAVLLLSIGDNWFCRGMARGLGTERVPALDFDEGTYTSGYSSEAVQAKHERYANWGAQVVHGGCLWAVKHPPTSPHFLSAQMYSFGIYGDGYWFWPGSMSVWRSSDEVSGYYSLSGYAEDYWKSIVVANREMDRRLEDPDGYRSPLEQLRQRPEIPREPPAGEKNEWADKPCYPVHVYSGTRLSFVVPAGRKSIQLQWGYRETLGEQTLLASVAGEEQRLTGTVEADRANVADLDVPEGGCTGWVELQGSEARGGPCVGLRLVGAKPFFGGPHGMGLR